MSPVSKQVEAAGIQGIERKRNPQRMKSHDFFETPDRLRERFGTLINAPATSVAIVGSASYGIATVARNISVTPGATIVVVSEQFPSNVYSWKRLALENGARLHCVEAPAVSKQRGIVWNQHILEAINKHTAVVALPHVHWADGTLFDLEAIGERARDVGAYLIVDGTQSIGAYPFDTAAIQPDALICAGYKWLMGPYGIGLSYYGPRFSEGIPLEENWINRKDSEHFGGLVNYKDEYQPGCVRYDVGGRSNFILLPMLDAGLAQLQAWGVARIQSYCTNLITPFLPELVEAGYWIEEAESRSSHLFGVRVREEVSMERLIEAITSANISVSIRGNAVRISPHVYNTREDLAALVDIFKNVAASTSISA